MSEKSITALLNDWGQGDEGAFEILVELVYSDLRALSRKILSDERRLHLESRELVHLFYQSLANKQALDWQSEKHFFGVAGRSMRRLLVAEARKYQTEKRGGNYRNTTFEDEQDTSLSFDHETRIQVDGLLNQLITVDKLSVQIIELRFFAGLSVQETARALDISSAKTVRKWRYAKAWLAEQIQVQNGSR